MSEAETNAEIAIDVKNISKEYFMGNNHSVKDGDKHFFALNDVSFTLYRGDVLGIIGSNGSGKSTLLKILSQITKPSSGEAHFYGSVTSILDVGNNFHPDLTGRENVKIQLKLADVPSREFDTYYQKVEMFSEIGEFFDQPIKYYSSGMFLRLAFSLVFHLSSDILILDEVLSVGDEGFRLKCQELLKMFAQSGKTILFVSHNRLEILELSNKCIWLDKGRVKKIGTPSIILGEYFSLQRDNFDGKKLIIEVDQSKNGTTHSADGAVYEVWDEANAPGNDIIAIRELSVTSKMSRDIIYRSEPIDVKFVIQKKQCEIKIGAFFFIQDIFYQPVLVGHFLNNTLNEDMSRRLKYETGLIEIKCTIPANFLEPGKYYLLPRFGMEREEWNPHSTEAFRFSEKLNFEVHAEPDYVDFVGDFSKGAVRPPLDWSIQKIG